MSQSRQLAAIMFTDIVGYTALMGKDSNKALELVRISKEIQKPFVEKHHGQWLKEMGDGALAKFGTALDAVKCAIEIQRTSRADFDGDLRIGIHLGDITIENDDVYGDGVNVASRLESIADPGGVYISDNVEKSIRGQTDVQAKYLGEINLKNVNYGVRTYAIQGVGLPVPEVKDDKELSGHFLAEVQRRGVIQAGASYVVLSLLLILLLPYATSVVNLPTWSSIALLSILIACFPVALYLAWNYERSPEGFVRTSSRESWQNPLKPSQRKPFTGTFIIAGLVLVIAIMFFYPRFQSSGQESETSEANLESRVIDKSIAVLPFTNMSNDPEQEYFSDGITEEILNHLVQIEDLQVTSRTSVMGYKGTTKPLKVIAKELGVVHVLEGSVRKVGSQVRITVQLIDADTDKHLWSKSFDRKMDDVFAIQSDVAQQIAATLQAELLPEVKQRIELIPTNSTEAYNLYLLAMYKSDHGDPVAAQIELEKALEIDPEFADAYVKLASVKLASRVSWSADEPKINMDDELMESDKLVYKALEIEPHNINAYEWLAGSHLWIQWDFDFAEQHFRKVNELNPNYTGPLYVDFLLASGRFEEALDFSENAIKLDPISEEPYRSLVLSYTLLEKSRLAIETIESCLERNFTNIVFLMEVCRAYLYLKEYERTVVITQEFLTRYPHIRTPRPLGTKAIAHYHLGQISAAKELLTEIEKISNRTSTGSPSFYMAMVYAQMEEIDLAFQWLENAYQDNEVEMYWIKVEPLFEPLRSDHRWQVMLEKVGFPE